jgi:hypothetical protein
MSCSQEHLGELTRRWLIKLDTDFCQQQPPSDKARSGSYNDYGTWDK